MNCDFVNSTYGLDQLHFIQLCRISKYYAWIGYIQVCYIVTFESVALKSDYLINRTLINFFIFNYYWIRPFK